jgi:hypothetical protein
MQTYTLDPALQARIDKAKAVAGTDNPEAIRKALTTQTFNNDSQLQEAHQGQQTALSALDQMATFDKQLASNSNNANTQQMATDTANRNYAASLGTIDPNNAQATIASGPAMLDLSQIKGPSTDANAILNPFVAAGLSAGQSKAAQDTYNLADMMRSSRERSLGGEVNSLVQAYQLDLAEKQRQEELARQKAKEELAQKITASQTELEIKKQIGGDWTDPTTGKTYHIPTPQEKALADAQGKQNELMGKLGPNAKAIIDELSSGKSSLAAIMRKNPTVDKYALADLNTSIWGGLKEDDAGLRAMGLDPNEMMKRGVSRVGGTGSTSTIDSYVNSIKSGYTDVNKMLTDVKDPILQSQILNALQSQGYKNPSAPTAQYGGVKIDAATKSKASEYEGLLRKLSEVRSDLSSAIGGKKTGGINDLGIGVTGFLSQFAGDKGSDQASKTRAALNNLQASVRNKMFGSALSENEIKESQKILPSVSAQEQENLNRIEAKMNEKLNDYRSVLRTAGVPEEAIDEQIRQITGGGVINPSQPAAQTVGRFTVEVE